MSEEGIIRKALIDSEISQAITMYKSDLLKKLDERIAISEDKNKRFHKTPFRRGKISGLKLVKQLVKEE